MVLAGCNFLALSWIAYANRGMEKCKAIKAYEDKKALSVGRKAGGYQGNPTTKSNKNKKKQNQPYQNPKKKKKK